MRASLPVVLFVDRDPAWSRMFRANLRHRGATVLLASTAEASLSAPAPPDFIVLDDAVAGPGTPDLAFRFKELWPEARLHVLLSHPEGPAPAGFPRYSKTPADQMRLEEALEREMNDRLLPEESPSTEKPLVLCVDDDRFYVDSLSRILGRHGYRVAAFSDPHRALEALPRIKPDLAILDVMMPQMDGLTLAEDLRRRMGDGVPIVMLTARDGDRDMAEGYRRGATYYIPKPCPPQTVLNAVDYFVGDLDPEERELLETQL